LEGLKPVAETHTPKDPLELLAEQLLVPAHNRWLGARAISADSDRKTIEVALAFRPEFGIHLRDNLFHGGIIASLIDVTGHASVAVWLGGGVNPTISLQIDYLTPAPGPELRATGILRRSGRTIACSDIEVHAAGRLVALGRGRFSTVGR
jgi:uncharacterized protein (TIGR00369 family)